jgi:hypothetical protein
MTDAQEQFIREFLPLVERVVVWGGIVDVGWEGVCIHGSRGRSCVRVGGRDGSQFVFRRMVNEEPEIGAIEALRAMVQKEARHEDDSMQQPG